MCPKSFGEREVEAEQVALVVGCHRLILTSVDALVSGAA